MGNCVSRINKLETQYSKLSGDLKGQEVQAQIDKQTIEAYFHSLRMLATKEIMKQINTLYGSRSITVTPEQIIQANPSIFRDIGLSIPIEVNDREIFWITFFNAKGVNLPVIRHMQTALGPIDVEVLVMDNPILIRMCRDQRLIEYAEIFLNVILFQDAPEPLERKSEIVGLTFRNYGDEDTYNNGTVTLYQSQGPVTRPVSKRKMKIQQSFVDEVASREPSDRQIKMNDWIDYLSLIDNNKCNIVLSLYGESFSRIVKVQERFRSCSSKREELSWEEFVMFMDKAFISVFEPPVSHQTLMKFDFNYKDIVFGKWKDSFNGKMLREGQHGALWMNCMVLGVDHMSMLKNKMNLFIEKNGVVVDNSIEIQLDDFFSWLESSDSHAQDVYALLEMMKIDTNILQQVLRTGIAQNEDNHTQYLTIHHLIMAVKLIGYGNAFFELAQELTFSTKDEKKGLVGIGETNSWNNRLSEFRCLSWLHDIAMSDEAVDTTGEDFDLEFHRRFTFVVEAIDEYKKSMRSSSNAGEEEDDDDDEEEVTLNPSQWLSYIVPGAIAKWNDVHRLAYLNVDGDSSKESSDAEEEGKSDVPVSAFVVTLATPTTTTTTT